MISDTISPYTAYQMCCRHEPFDKVKMLGFIQHAPARELQEFILLGRDKFGTAGAFNREWLEQAVISMHVRIGEDNVKAANTITSELTEQTNALVTESRNLKALTQTLTKQNATIITESKQIRYLTWGLLIFTALLLSYTIWHDLKHDK